MITLIVGFVLAIQAVQPPAQPAAPAQPRRAAAPPPKPVNVNVEVVVTDRAGMALPGINVSAEGPLGRESRSNDEGKLTLWSVPAGTYRVRAEGEGFVPFEKEVLVRAGAPMSINFAMTAAPPAAPVAPPPPPPSAKEQPITPGDPKMLSLPDLAEKSLGGRDPVKTVALGCSGLSRADLLIIRDDVPASTQGDLDETLYLVAGEATLTLGGKEQILGPGWFALIPRGSSHGLRRRGRNPAIFLSVKGGPRCQP